MKGAHHIESRMIVTLTIAEVTALLGERTTHIVRDEVGELVNEPPTR